MTSEAPTLVERLQDEADLCRNEGVDCDVVQLVRHSDAIAAIQRLEAENANLRSVMVAAAEEISAHWAAHCDDEGYGPANLMRRLEEGIPTEYAYTAGDFARLKAENEALKKEASDAATALPQAVRNERERWEAAVRAACKLIDPLHPAGQPGSYARGFDVGVETALRTLREVLDAAMTKEQKE
jgi:hypothetical protein